MAYFWITHSTWNFRLPLYPDALTLPSMFSLFIFEIICYISFLFYSISLTTISNSRLWQNLNPFPQAFYDRRKIATDSHFDKSGFSLVFLTFILHFSVSYLRKIRIAQVIGQLETKRSSAPWKINKRHVIQLRHDVSSLFRWVFFSF